MWFELAIIVALIVLNGLFSGAEMATVTLRKSRLDQLVAEGRAGAAAVAQLRHNPERFLATVQVGITVVGAAAAAYGGDTLARRFAPLVSQVPWLAQYANQIAFVVVVVAISFLSLVFGELVPKSLALRATEPYALIVSRPLVWLAQLARPVVWLLTTTSNGILRVFGDRTSFTEGRMSPEEVRSLLEEAGNQGSVDKHAGEIATRALDLTSLVAADLMVSRNRIVTVPSSATLDELRQAFSTSGHSRVVVHDEGGLDQVTGYVSVRDAYTRGNEPVKSLVRPMVFIPDSMKAIDVMKELQRRAAHLAIVVDEHGGTAGLLTREDLVEELVGEMLSDHVKVRGGLLKLEDDGSAIVAGWTPVREINRALDFGLPENDAWTTVAGAALAHAGHIPRKGERIEIPHGPTLVVVDATVRSIRTLRVIPRVKEPSPQEPLKTPSTPTRTTLAPA